jgi:hypothetical protein
MYLKVVISFEFLKKTRFFISCSFSPFYFAPLDLRNSSVLRGFDPSAVSSPPVSSRVRGLVLLRFLQSAVDIVL